MDFDFSSVKPSKNEDRIVNPIDLFHSLRVQDPSVNDLWYAQGQALEEWHDDRDLSDVAISLNTGAGKTLVGLLLAQSLVNETKGQVLYACSSIQLVDQTREKAEGYGLEVTTYYRQNYSNNLFQQYKAPCITTYQALFNGKSKFFRENISAVIFDDAHTANDALRDQFTLNIEVSTMPQAYVSIFAVFKDYFHRADRGIRFDEVMERRSEWVLLVPSFEILRHKERLLRILHDADLESKQSTLFAWEHLKDHIEQCAFLLSEGCVTITPAYVPIRELPYFSHTPRRVYLSATLDAEDNFIRTFGTRPSKVIAPKTNAGECERLILFPNLQKDVEGDVEATIAAVKDYKTLFLTPTYKRAEVWGDIVIPPERDKVAEHVSTFRASKNESEKLILTARYDGVDLPGDTCRMMVVDDLPSKSNMLDRYLWSFLKMSKTLRSIIASKIVQSFGRISRGNSDYGIVFVTGQHLVDWLQPPDNRASLPEFLQKQIMLGISISESASCAQTSSIIRGVLDREKKWLNSYEQFIKAQETEILNREVNLESEIALAEAKFAELFWQRKYTKAAQKLKNVLPKSRSLSSSTEAWHSYWLATALLLAGDDKSAYGYFKTASALQNELPRPTADNEQELEHSSQINNVSLQLIEKEGGDYSPPLSLDASLEPLITMEATSSQYEESLRVLGLFLGARSSRPEKEHGTGPDVLWIFDRVAVCIDAKSDKQEGSEYRKKDDIGQMADHVEWVWKSEEVDTVITAFAGPLLPASRKSNPKKELCIFSKDQIRDLAKKVQSSYRDIASSAMPITLRVTISEEFESNGLLAEYILSEIQKHRLINIHAD